MTYNPNIPQSTDLISNSQPDILTNFSQLNTIFATDHYTWNDATSANRGLHKQITFPAVLGSDPTVTGATGEIYTKTVSALTQLFFSNENTVTQLTGGDSSLAGSGYVTFPGGLILQWGVTSVNGSGTVTYPLAFPNAVFIVQITPENNSRTYNYTTPTTTNFIAVASSSGGGNFAWLALGN